MKEWNEHVHKVIQYCTRCFLAQRVWSRVYSSAKSRVTPYAFKQAPALSCRGSNQMTEVTIINCIIIARKNLANRMDRGYLCMYVHLLTCGSSPSFACSRANAYMVWYVVVCRHRVNLPINCGLICKMHVLAVMTYLSSFWEKYHCQVNSDNRMLFNLAGNALNSINSVPFYTCMGWASFNWRTLLHTRLLEHVLRWWVDWSWI